MLNKVSIFREDSVRVAAERRTTPKWVISEYAQGLKQHRGSPGAWRRLSGLLSSLLPPSRPPANFSALPPRAGVEGDTHPGWKELL